MAAAPRAGARAGRSRSAPLPGEQAGAVPSAPDSEFDPLLGAAHRPRAAAAATRRLVGGAAAAVCVFVAGVAVGRSTQHRDSGLHLTPPGGGGSGAAARWRHEPAVPEEKTGEAQGAVPVAANIFDQLSPAEVRAVASAFCTATGAAQSIATALPNQDFLAGVACVELYATPKERAVAHLSGRAPAPARFAKVTVARPSRGDVMEFRVGPITGSRSEPVVGSESHQLFADGAIPFARRPPELADTSQQPQIDRQLLSLRAVLERRFGAVWPQFDSFNQTQGVIMGFPVFPVMTSNSKSRLSTCKFFWYADPSQFNQAMWLHPVPFVFQVNQTGNGWEALNFYICGVGPYATAEDMVAAEAAGTLPRCEWRADPVANTWPGQWDHAGLPDRTADPRSNQHAAAQHLPDGKRWRTAGAPGGVGRQVHWMGWSFFVSVSPTKGLALWDVRFKGNRIAYEISLQEAAATYGGGQGDQTYYLDSALTGLGLFSPALRPGVDCPSFAEPLYTTTWALVSAKKGFETSPGKSIAVPSGCMFEKDTGKTLWSHVDLMGTKRTTGVRGAEFVVRSLTNSGNYDYWNSAVFRLDGSLRWETDFAGYMETRWYSPKFNDWEKHLSPIVHDQLAAPLHAHLLNVKVDLDIHDYRSNSVHKMESVVGIPPGDAPAGTWSSEPTKWLRHGYVANEGSGVSTFVQNSHTPQVWRVVDRNASGPASQHGWAPGYAILPGEAAVQTLPASHPLTRLAAFAKYAGVFTKHHDSEREATSLYDIFDPMHPRASLDHYLADEESLDGTDVVAWVTLPHEHFPRTEDLPLITNYPVSFTIVPWNYFDNNAGMDLPTEAATDSC